MAFQNIFPQKVFASNLIFKPRTTEKSKQKSSKLINFYFFTQQLLMLLTDIIIRLHKKFPLLSAVRCREERKALQTCVHRCSGSKALPLEAEKLNGNDDDDDVRSSPSRQPASRLIAIGAIFLPAVQFRFGRTKANVLTGKRDEDYAE